MSQDLRRFLDLARIGRDAAHTMHALVEEAGWVVVGLGLHVLAEGERHRPAFGRIGQDRQSRVLSAGTICSGRVMRSK